MSTSKALVRTPAQEFGRPARRRLTSPPTDDGDDAAQVDRALEGLARRAFPPEDGFSLDVRRSPGRVRSVQIIVACDAFDGVCAITTHMAGGGYRGDDVAVAIDIRREASQRAMDFTPGPPRIPVARAVVIIAVFTLSCMVMLGWVLPGLHDAFIIAFIAVAMVGLRFVRAREIRRTRRLDHQQAASALAEQESRWQWFGEEVDAALGGLDLDRKSLDCGARTTSGAATPTPRPDRG